MKAVVPARTRSGVAPGSAPQSPSVPLPASTGRGWLRLWDIWLLVLLALGAWIIHRDYGLQWDSSAHTMYGERVLDYWLSGGADRRAITDAGLMSSYGVWVDLPSAVLHRALGLDPYALRGFLSALIGVLTLVPVIRIGRLLGGEICAVASAAALVLMPSFFGHALINQKDIPLACGVAWCAWSAVRLGVLRQRSWGAWLGAGMAAGLTLGVRIGALFIALLWAAPLAVAAWERWRAHTGLRGVDRPIALAGRAGIALGLACFLVVLPWPYLHEAPLAHLRDNLRLSTTFPVSYPCLFAGQMINSDHLPRSYLPVYLALSWPLALLGAFVLGLARWVWTAWREPARRRLLAVLAAWGFAPVLAVMLLRPNLYDTTRHFLFTLPAFALLMGWGLAGAADWLGARLRRPALAPMLTAVVLATAVPPLIVWHPYQYAYTNPLAGDPATRHRRWDTDYWVTSYREAAIWINARQAESERPLRVLVAANENSYPCFSHYLDPRVQWSAFMARVNDAVLPADADYYVATVRYGMADNFPAAPVAHVIGRAGVTFTVIKARAVPKA